MDIVDRVNQEIEIHEKVNKTNREQELKRLKKLPAIKECIECGEHIPEARRAVLPGCRYCIACATRNEILNRKK